MRPDRNFAIGYEYQRRSPERDRHVDGRRADAGQRGRLDRHREHQHGRRVRSQGAAEQLPGRVRPHARRGRAVWSGSPARAISTAASAISNATSSSTPTTSSATDNGVAEGPLPVQHVFVHDRRARSTSRGSSIRERTSCSSSGARSSGRNRSAVPITFVTMPTALERTGDFSQSRYPNGTKLIMVKDPLTGSPFAGKHRRRRTASTRTARRC